MILEVKGASKKYGDLWALNKINFSVEKGEIHAVLGENGAGKTTLMNLLFGLIQPDEGTLYFKEKPISKHHIAMVHQHFMLSPKQTVAENLELAAVETSSLFFSKSSIKKRAERLIQEFGLQLNPNQKVETLTVGEQQRLEILKALNQNCEVLILDEPTSLLTPQEVEKLIAIFKQLKQKGVTLIFISHKIKEVKSFCDRATILKKGHLVGTFNLKDISENEIALKMFQKESSLKLETEGASEKNKSPWITFKMNAQSIVFNKGEITSVVGVDGNGQKELANAVLGKRNSIASERNCFASKIGSIPSDRQKEGLVLSMTLEENYLLKPKYLKECSRFSFINKKIINRFSRHLIHHYGIAAKSEKDFASSLSGGNQQKIVVSRELALKPDALVAVNPTWGLDMEGTNYVHSQLIELKKNNAGVLLITIDLDEALKLSDRIFVIYKNKLTELPKAEWTYERIGLEMGGVS